jgi:hypothetical protein
LNKLVKDEYKDLKGVYQLLSMIILTGEVLSPSYYPFPSRNPEKKGTLKDNS